MKKWLIGLTVLIAGAMFLVSCSTTGGGGGGSYSIFGENSVPEYYISDGDVQANNPVAPVSGTDVTNAIVTLSNESTGVSAALTYSAGGGGFPGSYTVPGSTFSHLPGEDISVKIEIGTETITGGPTQTPDTYFTNLSPASGSVAHFPVTISWEVTTTQYDATHARVLVLDGANPTNSTMKVVPIATHSITISSSEVSAGTFFIYAIPVTAMNLNGAKTGSVVYVSSSSVPPSWSTSVVFQ